MGRIITWFCSNCGDGPIGDWQNTCSNCPHIRCISCRTEYDKGASHVAAETSSGIRRTMKGSGGGGSGSGKPAQSSQRRCGKCGETGHNARTCQKHTEASSKSDSLSSYEGSIIREASMQQSDDHTQAEEPSVDVAFFPSQTAPAIRSTSVAVRGQWICACGDVIYDNYLERVEGAVEAAMKELNSSRSNNQLPSPTTHSAPRRRFKDVLLSVWDGLNAFTKILSIPIDRWRHKKDNGKGTSNNGQEMTVIHEDESCHHKFLFLCISQWKRYYITKIVSIDLETIKSDKALFQLLRKNYNIMIGPWRRFLSLKYISDIRFVQFHTTRNSIITIKQHSCVPGQVPPDKHPGYLPSQSCLNYPPQAPHPEYSYKPVPVTMDPPIGHNTMLHFYQCPQIGDGLDFCLKRFPKHVRDKVYVEDGNDEATAWGIELLEGRYWAYLWFIGLLAISCSMVFGVIWAKVMKDVSGGFTVAGYIVTAFACLVGSIQVSLETM